MAQTIRLASDNAAWPDVWSKVGGSGTYASCLQGNDGDTSYISKTGNITNTGSPAMKFTSFTRPVSNTGWTLNFIGKTESGTNLPGGSLYQGDPNAGGTLVCTVSGLGNHNPLGYSLQTYTLTSIEAALVTDASNLYYLANMGGSAVALRYTDIYLTTPDAVLPSGDLIPMTGAG